ncbi:tetratricopeptide repeat protein [Streptomyces sp. NPDC059256]|uniref:tetratricopeptide repeat protein n=1 Tax=Streptomyces sp. NPDC059256 TaxID=3346794 RepID=UPI0036A8D4C8
MLRFTDGTTVVLITSRHTLDIDARLHDLNVLDSDASVALLHQALLQTRGPADTRVQDDPGVAADIGDLCTGLPLALRIAAALLADTPTRPLTPLAQALQAEHSRLDRLRREDRAVRAAFDLSYRHLSNASARLFRLFPLNAGPDLSTESTTALADLDDFTTEEILQDLNRAHLIETSGSTWGRWRMHGLIRLYADGHSLDSEHHAQRTAGIKRLYAHYLAMALDAYLNLSRSFAVAVALHEASLACAVHLGSLEGRAKSLNNLGIDYNEVGRNEEAIAAFTHSGQLCAELGDHSERAKTLNGLGTVLRETGNPAEAVKAHQEALILQS